MICDRIRTLREAANLSQSALAKHLEVSRSAVNAWEMGLSSPTTQYVIEMAKLFHISADYLLEIDNTETIRLDGFSPAQKQLLQTLVQYFNDEASSQ